MKVEYEVEAKREQRERVSLECIQVVDPSATALPTEHHGPSGFHPARIELVYRRVHADFEAVRLLPIGHRLVLEL